MRTVSRAAAGVLAGAAAAAASACNGQPPRHPAAGTRTQTLEAPAPEPSSTAPTRPRPAPPATVPPIRPARVLVGQIPERLPTRRHVVALTFDAGADDAGAPKILATLQATHAPATFFLTGRWIQLYPQWARRIAARYPIGNHTYDHRDLLGLAPPGVRTEIVKAEAAITAISKGSATHLFRFPYGSSDPGTLRIANELGYTAVGWTVDTLGWEGTSGGQTVATVIARALGHLGPGEIILMHVGANPTDHTTLDADALAAVIEGIRRHGYALVTVPAFL
jgi:peptidoglycan/xylan/chitin deacetylase (PgdA/CDA1 family)